jgi:hypothetical protein
MTTPLGEAFTRWTIRIALALAMAALAARIAHRNRAARLAWTAGCLTFLAHVVCAFHFYHAWSHDAAYLATARDTAALFGLDWGGGLYFNYGFTLVWIADVVWWWVRPASYETRPRWVSAAVYGFFAFMAFNGAVVFASGPTRWTSLVVCTAVSLMFWLRVRRK